MSLASWLRTTIRSVLSPEQAQTLRRYQALHFRGLQHLVYRGLCGSNLRALAQIYNSDKWGRHWYAQHYETHFRPLRRHKLTLLEIGIGGYDRPEDGGGSLRMWRTYFPQAQIVGIDIYDKRPHEERRIRTFRGSQVDAEFLDKVMKEIGPVDIIIDDGSHINEHVLQTFDLLFPRLAPHGLYVIEDLQTAYWKTYGGTSGNEAHTPTSLTLLKNLVDGLHFAEYELPHYSPSYTDTHVVGLHFYHNIAFIQKGLNDEEGGTADLGRRMVFASTSSESVVS